MITNYSGRTIMFALYFTSFQVERSMNKCQINQLFFLQLHEELPPLPRLDSVNPSLRWRRDCWTTARSTSAECRGQIYCIIWWKGSNWITWSSHMHWVDRWVRQKRYCVAFSLYFRLRPAANRYPHWTSQLLFLNVFAKNALRYTPWLLARIPIQIVLQ